MGEGKRRASAHAFADGYEAGHAAACAEQRERWDARYRLRDPMRMAWLHPHAWSTRDGNVWDIVAGWDEVPSGVASECWVCGNAPRPDGEVVALCWACVCLGYEHHGTASGRESPGLVWESRAEIRRRRRAGEAPPRFERRAGVDVPIAEPEPSPTETLVVTRDALPRSVRDLPMHALARALVRSTPAVEPPRVRGIIRPLVLGARSA